MDKFHQDIHLVIKDEEVWALRDIDVHEILKNPATIIIRYGDNRTPRIYQLLIPVLPHMKLIID